MDANLFGHLANVLFGLAYLVKDILWLRLISIVACFIMIFFNYFSPAEPLWVAIFWNAFFITVNVARSVLLVMERRQTRFNEIEQEMYDTVFNKLSQVEFAKLLRAGFWKYFKPESMILEKGTAPGALLLLYNGCASVLRGDDKSQVELRDGAFIGEMAMVTDGLASADVRAETQIKAYCWPQSNLENLFRQNPNLRGAFQMILASDMARKLKTG